MAEAAGACCVCKMVGNQARREQVMPDMCEARTAPRQGQPHTEREMRMGSHEWSGARI